MVNTMPAKLANGRARHARRRGLTLLELILALALSVAVMVAVGMSIDIYFRMFDTRRSNVEEALLARALLRHMADDLRSTVQYTPPDLSGLALVAANGETAATNASNSASQAGGGEASGDDAGADAPAGDSGDSGADAGAGTGGGDTEADTSGNAVQPTTTTEEETGLSLPVVGLYGTATEFSVDVSKLPRVDQYQMLVDSSSNLGVVDIPSDVKTITYFIRSEESASLSAASLGGEGRAEPSSTGIGRGLMRRELDRAVTTWAEMNGNLDVSTADAKMLADEVIGMQIRYFDGSQWLTEWDSTASGGLPVAVEIILVITTVGIDQAEAQQSDSPTLQAAAAAQRQYRMVVHLPHAVPAEVLAEQEAIEAEAAAISGAQQ